MDECASLPVMQLYRDRAEIHELAIWTSQIDALQIQRETVQMYMRGDTCELVHVPRKLTYNVFPGHSPMLFIETNHINTGSYTYYHHHKYNI